MKPAQGSHPLAHAGQSLFATSLGASVVVHGLIIAWMLSGGGPSQALLVDLPAFHSVSLVNAPAPAPPAEPVASVPEPEPQAVPEAVAVPAAVNPAPVRDVAPEPVVVPPQATPATEGTEASVEPPAPAASPKPVDVPERPVAVDTQAQQPKPARATEAKPAPTAVAAARPDTAAPPPVAAQPRAPASRNSPEAAARAREAIANLRARTGPQGAGGDQPDFREAQMLTYQQRVRDKITQALHLPMIQQRAQNLKAVTLLTIDREGRLIRYEMTQSSGDPSFDASVHRAVQASSPLPPLPETYSDETLQAEIHFTPPASS